MIGGKPIRAKASAAVNAALADLGRISRFELPIRT
jgi:hypothetical protein